LSLWHTKTPHFLNSIPYCLTNGVQFRKHPKGSLKRTKEQDVAFSTHFKAVLEASRRLML